VSRFYIGGEDSIRGFDVRAITPMAYVPVTTSVPVFFLDPTRLDENGNPTPRVTTINVLTETISFPGGDAQLVGNAEYRIPVMGPVTIAPFVDVGLNTVLRPSQLRLSEEALEALRVTFPRREFGDQLTLVPNTNTRVRSSVGLEVVVTLPILNAPFRVYWAYNVARISEDIVVHSASFEVPAGVELPPGVFENQIVPLLSGSEIFRERTAAFIEPLKTFRFTVSRTF
jgi:outer membrane protein insertion porin family